MTRARDRLLYVLRVLASLVRLVRPLNTVLFALGTLLGAFLIGGFDAFLQDPVWLAAGAATLVGAAANVINDVFDLEIDRINRPDRPVASGAVSPQVARVTWGVLSVVGIGLAAMVSRTHGLVAVLSVAALFGYSARLKQVALAGNLVVALVVSTALPFGAMAAGSIAGALPAAFFAFCVTFAREVVKDIEDLPGDMAAGARTLPVVTGTRVASVVARVVIGVTAVVAPLPSIVLGYPDLYLLLLVPTCGTLLVAATYLRGSDVRAHDASRMLKIAMMLGMAALTTASF